MAIDVQGLINAGIMADLECKGCVVETSSVHTVVVLARDDEIYTLDNH